MESCAYFPFGTQYFWSASQEHGAVLCHEVDGHNKAHEGHNVEGDAGMSRAKTTPPVEKDGRDQDGDKSRQVAKLRQQQSEDERHG